MKIAICDDEENVRNLIKNITQQVISISLGTSATTGGSFDIKA